MPFLMLLYPLFIRLRKYIKVDTSNKYFCSFLILFFMCFMLAFYTVQTIYYNDYLCKNYQNMILYD